MSNERQWFWTKFLGSVLSLMLILSIAVGATNMHYQLSHRVDRNASDIQEHKANDEKKWDKVWNDVEANDDGINQLKLQQAEDKQRDLEILRRLERIESKLDSWEPTDA